MIWQGKIDFEKPITLKGKPHGIEQFNTMPEWDSSLKGQLFYVENENKVYVGTSSGFTELSPSGTTHDHNYLYHTRAEINSKFDVGEGHDHDGVNSKKVAYSNLSGTPSEFNPSSHGNDHHSANYIIASEVTYNVLNNNSVVGTGSSQIAKGDHLHDDRYFTETEIGASTGASLIGVSNILNQTTVQDAFESLISQLNNYRLVTDSYTKSEINLDFVNVASAQEITGEKTFSSNTMFKSNIILEKDLIPEDEKEINLGSNDNKIKNIYIESLVLDDESFNKSDLIKASYLYTQSDLQTSGESQVHWDNLISVPATFNPSDHDHDDFYYTKFESDENYVSKENDYTTKEENDELYSDKEHTHTISSITDFNTDNLVHTSGDEIIDGTKTFSEIITNTIDTNSILTSSIQLNIENNIYPGIIVTRESGISVLKYDFELNNYTIDHISQEDQTTTTISSIIATRDDTLIDKSIPFWNDETKQFESSNVNVDENGNILGLESEQASIIAGSGLSSSEDENGQTLSVDFNEVAKESHSHTLSSLGFTDSDYVHKTGDETINGDKTFNQINTQSISSKNIILDLNENQFPGIIATNDSVASIIKYDSDSKNYTIEQLELNEQNEPTVISSSIIATREYVDERGFIPSYGMMYADSISSEATSYTILPLSDGGVSSSDITYNSSGYLEISKPGVYQISVSGDATGVASKHHLEIRINGESTQLKHDSDLSVSTYRNFSFGGLLNISKNDQISLYQHQGAENGSVSYFNLLFRIVRIA